MPEGRLFGSDRNDGRFVSSLAGVHDVYRRSRPRLALECCENPEQVPAWQSRVRSRLRKVLSFPTSPPQPPPLLVGREHRDGYELQRWELYPEPGVVAPFLTLVPNGASRKKRVPLVLCFPGTDHSKELLAGEEETHGRPGNPDVWFPEHNRMAWWYARHGMAAVAIDNPGTCEQAEPQLPGRSALVYALLWLGRNYLGLSTYRGLQLYRWAKKLPFVDPKRIAVSGHSLGTGPATALAVLEPRIAALVYNGNLQSRRAAAVSTGLEPMPPWHYTPGLLEWFDLPDLVAAVAPRPALVCEGGLGYDLRRVRRIYRLLDASSAFKVHHFPKYSNRACRKTDKRYPPEGLTKEEFKTWAVLDSSQHYFKEKAAAPWLLRQMSCKSQDNMS